MYKRIILAVLCFTLVFSLGSTALKDGLSAVAYGETTIEQDRATLNELKNTLSSIQANKDNLQSLISQTDMATQTMLEEKLLLDQEYILLAEEESAINLIIDEYEVIKAQTSEEKAQAEATLEKQLEDFGSLLVYMYIHGDDSRLEIFLKSESYSEYLAYVECMESLLESSDRMIGTITETINGIKVKEEEYAIASDALVEYRESLVTAQAEKEAKSQEILDKMGENNELIQLTEEEIAAMDNNEEALRLQIADLQKQIEDKLAATYNGIFSFPLVNCSYRITSEFGPRYDGPFVSYEHHNGMDFACAKGTGIKAVDKGRVTFAGYNGAFGNVVFIEHGGGLTTVYAHCDSLLVSAGATVSKDQVIARVGSTGLSSGPHLHFAVVKNGEYVDPREYLFG